MSLVRKYLIQCCAEIQAKYDKSITEINSEIQLRNHKIQESILFLKSKTKDDSSKFLLIWMENEINFKRKPLSHFININPKNFCKVVETFTDEVKVLNKTLNLPPNGERQEGLELSEFTKIMFNCQFDKITGKISNLKSLFDSILSGCESLSSLTEVKYERIRIKTPDRVPEKPDLDIPDYEKLKNKVTGREINWNVEDTLSKGYFLIKNVPINLIMDITVFSTKRLYDYSESALSGRQCEPPEISTRVNNGNIFDVENWYSLDNHRVMIAFLTGAKTIPIKIKLNFHQSQEIVDYTLQRLDKILLEHSAYYTSFDDMKKLNIMNKKG